MPVGFWPLRGFGASDEEVRGAEGRFRDAYFLEMLSAQGEGGEKGERGVWCKFTYNGYSIPRRAYGTDLLGS